jgi:hypothetical protein
MGLPVSPLHMEGNNSSCHTGRSMCSKVEAGYEFAAVPFHLSLCQALQGKTA